MNRGEIKRARAEGWSDLWYIVRVLTGVFLHFFMILCVIALVEHLYVIMEIVAHRTDPISHAYSQQVHVLVAVATFAAGMSGASWVKSLYIRHVLPEAMDDITKKILSKP